MEDKLVSGEDTRSTPMSELPLAWETIDRYYAGEATAAEATSVQMYLAEHPARNKVFVQLLQKLGKSPGRISKAPVDSMLMAAHERMLPANVIKRVVRTLFAGSTERAVAALLDLEDPELNEGEMERLRHLIDRAKREGR